MFLRMNIEKTTTRFAKVYGVAGEGPRMVGLVHVFWPLIPICIAAGWLLHAAVPFPRLSTSQAGVLLVLLAAALVAFMGWSSKRLRSFLKGAEGEETVARILSFLPAPYTVFNDLQMNPTGPTLDHIVAAPAGLFVIETKNWSGEITFVNGQVLCNGKPPSRSPLKQVKEQAEALHTYLSATGCPEAPIRPVICFVSNPLQGGVTNIGGVLICCDSDLPALFDNPLDAPVPAGSLAMIISELARCAEDR